jgi:O-antigen/teichoic acid export membrane protein
MADTLRGFGLLAATTILGQLLGFIALAIVSRRIGATALGDYNFALTLSVYFGLLANSGLPYVATRDASVAPSEISGIAREVLTLQVIAAVTAYVALNILAIVLAPNGQTRSLIPIVGLTIIATAATLDWMLLALGRRSVVAAARLLGQIAYAALVPVLVTSADGVGSYAWLNVLGLGVTAALIGTAVLRRGLLKPGPLTRHKLHRRVRRSMTMSYSLVMIQVSNVSGVLILGYLASARDVGIYAVAFRLPYSVVMLANIWIQVFFPHAASAIRSDPTRFRADFSRVLSAACVLSIAIAGGAAVVAPRLMPALFGSAFTDASTPFAILAAAMSLVLLEAILSNVLIAGARDRLYATLLTGTAISNVVLNLVLATWLQASGAALAAFTTEAMLVILTLLGAKRVLGRFTLQWARVARGILGVALMCVVLRVMLWHAPLALVIACGVTTFAFSAIALRPFDPGLWRREA